MAYRYERWSDEDLALAFQGGDLEAGFALLDRHARFVYAVAGRLGVDAETAGDIFTEVWLKLQSQIGNFRFGSAFRAFLRTIVRSVVIDRARRETRHSGHVSLDAAGGDETEPLRDRLPSGENVDELILANEVAALTHRAVAELPERFREPLLLAAVEGLSHAEIAARLEIPANTAATRIFRGRERVRRQVEAWLRED